MNVRDVLREPIVHFLVLGTGLFAIAEITGNADSGRAERIIVTAGHVERLADGFHRTWQRAPTAEELARLVDDHIREEILFREALAMGLDLDDAIVRRRLAQKMRFLVEDIAAIEPEDDDLQTFLDENPDAFRAEARVSFRHVYFSQSSRGASAAADAQQALSALRADPGVDPATLGDPFSLPYDYESVPHSEVAGLFGAEFAAALPTAPLKEWSGPMESGYGVHLVNVSSRTEPRIPDLADVRAAVEREWKFARRQEANAEIYRQLRETYAVTVEWPEWAMTGR